MPIESSFLHYVAVATPADEFDSEVQYSNDVVLPNGLHNPRDFSAGTEMVTLGAYFLGIKILSVHRPYSILSGSYRVNEGQYEPTGGLKCCTIFER